MFRDFKFVETQSSDNSDIHTGENAFFHFLPFRRVRKIA
jgi:hypothetical protein